MQLHGMLQLSAPPTTPTCVHSSVLLTLLLNCRLHLCCVGHCLRLLHSCLCLLALLRRRLLLRLLHLLLWLGGGDSVLLSSHNRLCGRHLGGRLLALEQPAGQLHILQHHLGAAGACT